MKDFHDLYKLLDGSVRLREDTDAIIASVLAHRGTALRPPIDFAAADHAPIQELWTQHVQGLRSQEEIPRSLAEVIERINGLAKAQHVPVRQSPEQSTVAQP